MSHQDGIPSSETVLLYGGEIPMQESFARYYFRACSMLLNEMAIFMYVSRLSSSL